MAEYTTNYNLEKQQENEYININGINGNFDVIDLEMKNLEDEKVNKVDGKELSTNDYTNEEKEKLAGIAVKANNYVHPSTHPWNMITGAPDYNEEVREHTPLYINGSNYNSYIDAIRAMKTAGYWKGVIFACNYAPADTASIGSPGWSFVRWQCSCGNDIFYMELYVDRVARLYVRNVAEGDSGWLRINDGGNADTVDGHHESHFVRTRDYENIDVSLATYPYPYMVDVSNNPSMPDTDWFHVIYLPHSNYGAGYGAQIAIGFHGSPRTYIRSAAGTTWGSWRIICSELSVPVYVSQTAPGADQLWAW